MFMIRRMQNVLRNNEGFTLIELMIVVAIIGILAAVAVPNFLTYRNNARQAALMANGGAVRAALASYASTDASNLYPLVATVVADMEANGTTLPATVTTKTYVGTPVAAPTDYTFILGDVSGNQVCVTPASVVKMVGAAATCP
jgi:prepilin-type N-terminal cleavage/methylation domain-containing protein